MAIRLIALVISCEDPLPELKPGEIAMRVLHLGTPTVLGYINDGPVQTHQVLIICADIPTAQKAERELSASLTFSPDGRCIDQQWRVVLVPTEITCTCGRKPHTEADRELFAALQTVLAAQP